MSSLDQSIQNNARHAIYIQRFAGGLSNDFKDQFDKLKKELTGLLVLAHSTKTVTKKNNHIKEIQAILIVFFKTYLKTLTDELYSFAKYEADFEFNSLNDVLLSDSATIENAKTSDIMKELNTVPMVFNEANESVLLLTFLANWANKEVKRIANTIETSLILNESINQLLEKIIKQNGVINKKIAAGNKSLVRTAINHVSSIARHSVIKQNAVVIGYQWISILDNRTTVICRSLSNKRFFFKDSGYKPLPPIHMSCRSITSPILDKRFRHDESDKTRNAIGSNGREKVSADETYYTFLKKQSIEFQNDVLGKTRAKLFRDGGLNAEEFAALTVDQKYRPLTLKQMKERNKLVFDKAKV